MRIDKTINGTTSNQLSDLAEGLPVIIQDGATKEITGPGGLPIEQVGGDGTVLYYLQDQLGSARGLTDSSGNSRCADYQQSGRTEPAALVIARKVSAGIRSRAGPNVQMILGAPAATAWLQGIDPGGAFQRLLIPYLTGCEALQTKS